MSTCEKCLTFSQCLFGVRGKLACEDYLDDPFQLEQGSARWTFKLTQEAEMNNGMLGMDRSKFTVIAGPCVLDENHDAVQLASKLQEIATEVGVNFIFKASYDKANRTSISSYRGPGITKGLEMLAKVKQEVGCKITTDVHRDIDVPEVANVVDLIQIPAFLCRQTDLLVAAAKSGKPVNVKKGQFMMPEAMAEVVNKLSGAPEILLTERGTTFGYGDLVVDMRSLSIMRTGTKCNWVVFDVTHSCQRPSTGSTTGGSWAFAPMLARAAIATGYCDAIFMETQWLDGQAKSDIATSISTALFRDMLIQLKAIWDLNLRPIRCLV